MFQSSDAHCFDSDCARLLYSKWDSDFSVFLERQATYFSAALTAGK